MGFARALERKCVRGNRSSEDRHTSSRRKPGPSGDTPYRWFDEAAVGDTALLAEIPAFAGMTAYFFRLKSTETTFDPSSAATAIGWSLV